MIAIDVGNTKTAIGFFRKGVLAHRWTVATDPKRARDDYRHLLGDLLASEGIGTDEASSLIVASVVPSITEELLGLGSTYDMHLVNHQSPISFKFGIPDPSSLGADRIADAEAAVRKYKSPLIIVDAGTATTVSVLDEDRRFLGGAIAPGLNISADALFARTARLVRPPLNPPRIAIGPTTESALQIGIQYGHASLIHGLVEMALKELNQSGARIIATGGAIDLLAPFLRPEIGLDRTLTLEGLWFISENLRAGNSHA